MVMGERIEARPGHVVGSDQHWVKIAGDERTPADRRTRRPDRLPRSALKARPAAIGGPCDASSAAQIVGAA